ncbi:MAG: hypothetical protein A2X56_12915 [Nitrospirae bacterium GWC2_57_13]|nr:MAG: hypothetical protein A2X56_12915 [Nitrospirae bacterium GWC2_57_13]OGW42769.1 MAG: hypothetical protein A2X57_01805 [Nitrospirae bacterium GWD2_57_8]
MSMKKTRPHLSYTLLCDDVRQEMGGKFSLMGLFETIYANSFPAVHPRFAIVNEWSGGKGEFLVTIRLLSPDREQVLSESEATITLFSETQRHRDISIRFNSTFPAAGTYWIEHRIDNEVIGETSLSVQQVNKQNVH